jgi:predicted Zn-dependent protease
MRFTQNLIEAFNKVTALSKELSVVSLGLAGVMPSAKIEGFCFP